MWVVFRKLGEVAFCRRCMCLNNILPSDHQSCGASCLDCIGPSVVVRLVDVAGPWSGLLPGPVLCGGCWLLASELDLWGSWQWKLLGYRSYCWLADGQRWVLGWVVARPGFLHLVSASWYVGLVPDLGSRWTKKWCWPISEPQWIPGPYAKSPRYLMLVLPCLWVWLRPGDSQNWCQPASGQDQGPGYPEASASPLVGWARPWISDCRSLGVLGLVLAYWWAKSIPHSAGWAVQHVSKLVLTCYRAKSNPWGSWLRVRRCFRAGVGLSVLWGYSGPGAGVGSLMGRAESQGFCLQSSGGSGPSPLCSGIAVGSGGLRQLTCWWVELCLCPDNWLAWGRPVLGLTG